MEYIETLKERNITLSGMKDCNLLLINKIDGYSGITTNKNNIYYNGHKLYIDSFYNDIEMPRDFKDYEKNINYQLKL